MTLYTKYPVNVDWAKLRDRSANAPSNSVATVEARALNLEDITGSLRYFSGMEPLIGSHAMKYWNCSEALIIF